MDYKMPTFTFYTQETCVRARQMRVVPEERLDEFNQLVKKRFLEAQKDLLDCHPAEEFFEDEWEDLFYDVAGEVVGGFLVENCIEIDDYLDSYDEWEIEE